MIDVFQFVVFLTLWIFFFFLVQYILGVGNEVTTDLEKLLADDNDEEFKGLGYQWRMILNVLRTSIGDLQLPDETLWIHPEKGNSNVMIFLIYLAWVANIFFILIVLLNFLIAIVSNSHEKVINKGMVNKYKHQAILNRECRLHEAGKELPLECIIFSVATEHDHCVKSSWGGFVASIKNFIKE